VEDLLLQRAGNDAPFRLPEHTVVRDLEPYAVRTLADGDVAELRSVK
jgi:hypothetical protein